MIGAENMALEFLKLHDSKLAKAYGDRPRADETPKRRDRVIEGIDKMLAALKAGEVTPRRGWYSTRGDVVRVQLKHGSKPLAINGEKEFFIPRQRAADFYASARKSVEAGELDSSINALFAKSGGVSRRRGSMDPARLAERNRKRAATLAAKKQQQALE
jgi:hypothetical protein